MFMVVIPGLTRNPVQSWIMNIKLRFPASAGMTVLMYIDASRTSGVSAGKTVLRYIGAGAIMELEIGVQAPPLIDQRIEKNRYLSLINGTGIGESVPD
jgi:hypothetical protein